MCAGQDLKSVPAEDNALHNWGGDLIDRRIFAHLRVKHFIRCQTRFASRFQVGDWPYYFCITSIQPLRGTLSNIYNQCNSFPELEGIEIDLLWESISEVPTALFPDLQVIEEQLNLQT